ncbi:MAG: hypothetical protein JWL61_5457 [Gemmatimonadetes bacterium]|nr:hypothetical protein [Gemmatimonadota bacterium]
MKTDQGNVLQSLRIVQSFLDTHAASIRTINSTGARKQLDDAIIELAGHESEQSGKALAAQFETKKKTSCRRDLLKKNMTPISRIAQLELPRTEELFPLRMSKAGLSTARLAAAAYGMAKAAAPYSNIFVAAGLPADFLSSLTGAADAMLATVNDRAQHRSLSKGATRAIAVRLSTARKIIRVLDTLVSVALENDPKLLEAWNGVKRLPTPRRNTPPVVYTPPTTTSNPSTTLASESTTTPVATTG